MQRGHNIRKSILRVLILLLAIIVALLIIGLIPFGERQAVNYIDRSTGIEKTERIPGENWLVWLYHNPVGEAALHTLVKRKLISEWYGDMMDQPSSANRIGEFVEEFDIDMTESEQQRFNTFNEFFTRKLIAGARPIDTSEQVILSPADGKVLAYTDIAKADFIVKGIRFDVFSFLQDSVLASEFEHATLLVVRLAPPDYHRFHFAADGRIIKRALVDGDYFSVNPIALRERPEILFENKRTFTVIESDFGKWIMAEVGATMVGSIIQTFESKNIRKGGEKGYFKFGGSTVVLLFRAGEVTIDNDLIINTKRGLETRILMGERIGVKTR